MTITIRRKAGGTTKLHQLIMGSHRLSPSTKLVYTGNVNQYLAFAGEDPRGWTRLKTQQFYDHLLAAGMKAKSANNVILGVRHATALWAMETNDPGVDFTQIQLKLNDAPGPQRVLTADEARAMLKTCDRRRPRDLRDFAMMVVALETGMRCMSLADMKWENLKLGDVPTITVALKGIREPFAVTLSDTATLAFDPWRTFLAGRKISVKKGNILRRLDTSAGDVSVGATFSKQSIYNTIAERARDASVDGVHPHTFRHTFTTWRLAAGLGYWEVAAITGHRVTGDGSGALFTYANKQALGALARNKTPEWLAAYVADFVKRS